MSRTDFDVDSWLDDLSGAHGHAASVAARQEVLGVVELRSAIGREAEHGERVVRLVKALPDSMLVDLSTHRAEPVRVAVAGRGALKRLPTAVDCLLVDASAVVRSALARNRRIPYRQLASPEKDPDPEVRWHMHQRPDRPAS